MLKNGWYNSILVFQKKMMFKNMIFKIMIFWGITESPRFLHKLIGHFVVIPFFGFPRKMKKTGKGGKGKGRYSTFTPHQKTFILMVYCVNG